MLNTVAHEQAATMTYAASAVTSMQLECSGAITRIVIRIDLDPSGDMATNATEEEGITRLINSLRIIGGGGRVYYDIGNDGAGRMINWLARYDGVLRGTGHSALTTSVDCIFPIHFGSRPQHRHGWDNPYDLSAFIPAFDDDEIRIECLWPTTAAIDDTVTIDVDTFMHVTVYEVTGSKADLRAEMGRQAVRRVMVPTSTYFVDTPGGTAYTDYTRELDVPTGNFMRRILLMSHNDTATQPTRTDLEMTGIALVFPSVAQRLISDDFAALSMTQGCIEPDQIDALAVTAGLVYQMGGIGCLDMRQHADPDYGLDLRNYKVGDVKTGATTAGNADFDQFYWFDMLSEMPNLI